MPEPHRPPLEREAELRVIADQLDRACAGDGTLVVVEGPPGIGKTTLLRAAMDLGRARGMNVMYGRGGVLEQELEYGVARQLIERPILGASDEVRARILAGPAAPAAAVFGLSEPPADSGPGYDPSPDILHALHWVVANLAEPAPLMIVLDDAHWADAASLRAGGYLSRRLDGLAVAMLVATRVDEPGSHAALVTELLAAAEPEHVRPAPFTDGAVATVLREAFAGQEPSPELIDACRRASGGNPFFLTELATELAASHPTPDQIPGDVVDRTGPVAVRRSILLRLGHLGPDASALARAVATLGGEGELRHAAAVAGLQPPAAAQAADTLAAAGILHQDRPLRMVHALVRAAIDDDTPRAERGAAHRRALEVLAADGATDDVTVPHALVAEPREDAEVVRLLRRTAERALRTGSPEVAAVHLRRALDEPPAAGDRAEVLADLGRAQVRQGAFPDGLASLDQALMLLHDPVRRADIHRDRAFAAFAGAGMGSAQRLVREALQELGGADDGALQLEADLALLAWLTGSDAGPDLRRHGALTGRTRAERTLLALLSQSEHAAGADAEVVVELAERALAGGRLIREDTSEALSWYMATYSLLTCEANDAARATIDQALADAQRRGSAFAHAGALGTRAVLALNEGRPRDAEADARAAAAGAIPPIMVPVNAAYVVLALVDQGELEAAEEELVAAGIDQGPGGPTVLRWVPWARARLREAQGRPDAVRADVVPLQEDDDAGRPMRALAWRALLARSLARSGEGGQAGELAAAHLAWARGWGRPAALGIAQRAAALADTGEARAEGLREAVQTLAGSASRTEEARARLDLGVLLLRDGKRRDGRRELEAALEVALACGARGIAQAAADELRVAGAAPKKLRFDELTASERRVAQLAADGRTNREIAEELFVTPKTVENHLTRVYAKLGVTSRQALADVL